MTTSDAAKRASAALHARRKEAGWRKVTSWLSPEAVFKLDAVKAKAGGADAAINAALLAWNGPGEPKPVVEKAARTVTREMAYKSDEPGPKVVSAKMVRLRIGEGPQPVGEIINTPEKLARLAADVPLLQRKAFNPQPKSGKKK